MAASIKNIITASVAIAKMDPDTREQLLYSILEKNPTACITAMANNGITFADKIKEETTYKIVVKNASLDRKIATIKLCRYATGAGLADAKGWTEGKEYNGLPAGVLAKGLTKKDAEKRLAELKAVMDNDKFLYGIELMILRDKDQYTELSMMNR